MKCIPDDVFKALPVLKQTQRVTDDQLRDLVDIATRFGLYDAADVLRNVLARHPRV